MIWFLLYCGGFTATTATIFGANAYAKATDHKEPFSWDSGHWDDSGPVARNLSAMFVWPVAWVVFGVCVGVRALVRRSKRKIEAAKEYQRLLEQPLDGELIP